MNKKIATSETSPDVDAKSPPPKHEESLRQVFKHCIDNPPLIHVQKLRVCQPHKGNDWPPFRTKDGKKQWPTDGTDIGWNKPENAKPVDYILGKIFKVEPYGDSRSFVKYLPQISLPQTINKAGCSLFVFEIDDEERSKHAKRYLRQLKSQLKYDNLLLLRSTSGNAHIFAWASSINNKLKNKKLNWSVSSGQLDELKGNLSNDGITIANEESLILFCNWIIQTMYCKGIQSGCFSRVASPQKDASQDNSYSSNSEGNPKDEDEESNTDHLEQIRELSEVSSTDEISNLNMSPEQAKALIDPLVEARIKGYGINPRINEITNEVFVDESWSSHVVAGQGQMDKITVINLRKAISLTTVARFGRNGNQHIRPAKEDVIDNLVSVGFQNKYNPLADSIARIITRCRPYRDQIMESFEPESYLREMFVFDNEDKCKQLIPWFSMFLPYSILQRAIISPGCEINHYPCLVSIDSEKQGKTTFSQRFMPDNCMHLWTQDFNLKLKDEQMHRKLKHNVVIEAGEMSGIYNADFEKVKILLTNTQDDMRNLYENHLTTRLRRNTIILTCNSTKWLSADQENRRFIIFEVSRGPTSPAECYESEWLGTGLKVKDVWYAYAAFSLEDQGKVKWSDEGYFEVGDNPLKESEPMIGDMPDDLRSVSRINTTSYARSNDNIDSAVERCLPRLHSKAHECCHGRFVSNDMIRSLVAEDIITRQEKSHKESTARDMTDTEDGYEGEILYDEDERRRAIAKSIESMSAGKEWTSLKSSLSKVGLKKLSDPVTVGKDEDTGKAITKRGFVFTERFYDIQSMSDNIKANGEAIAPF